MRKFYLYIREYSLFRAQQSQRQITSKPACKTSPYRTSFSHVLFSILFCAIHFIVTLEMPLYLGERNLSTKWRRSRKHLKWLDLRSAKSRSKILRIEPMRTARGIYRSSQNYAKRKWKEPKPLIDIFQEKNWITIIAEIAGFNKETLKINVKDQKITLSAKAKDRRYYKSLNLPKVVIPNIMHTTYKNGVLEIKLKKAEKEETIDKKAD
jgi:HSP20 family molecular chaperone IbpA